MLYSELKNKLLQNLKPNQSLKNLILCFEFNGKGQIKREYYRATITNISQEEVKELIDIAQDTWGVQLEIEKDFNTELSQQNR